MDYKIAEMFTLILHEEKNDRILKTVEGEISLNMACFFDMIFKEVIEIHDDFSISVLKNLPDDLLYCKSIYKKIVNNQDKKVHNIIVDCVSTLNKKKRMVVIDEILSSAIKQQERGKINNWKAKKYFVEDIIDEKNEMKYEIVILFKLLLENKRVKKIFTNARQQQMKKVIQEFDGENFKQFNSLYKDILNKVMSEIEAIAAMASASAIILS